MNTKLYIVVPCYNEREALPNSAARLREKCETLIKNGVISEESRIMLTDDGSTDGTWALIEQLYNESPLFCGVKLSRNRGHQNALLAGLLTAAEFEPDAVISIDADLQDDINAIDLMIKDFEAGSDVVFGVRADRESDTLIKRVTAEAFYKTMRRLGVQTVFNHADCRLMSLRAVNGLAEYKEVNLYLRGIVPQIGYKSSVVEYDRSKRMAGESKYNLKKMLGLAADGITGFSLRPITFIVTLGAFLAATGFMGLITLAVLAACGVSITDMLWVIGAIAAVGGIQLFGTGLVGEYVGRAYFESKARPRYIIETVLSRDERSVGRA